MAKNGRINRPTLMTCSSLHPQTIPACVVPDLAVIERRPQTTEARGNVAIVAAPAPALRRSDDPATRRRTDGRSEDGIGSGLIPLAIASAAAVCALLLTVTPPITPDADVARRVTDMVLNFAVPERAQPRCTGSTSAAIHHPAREWPLL